MDLFSGIEPTVRDRITEQTQLVPGLVVIFDFISQVEEKALLESIDKEPWITNFKRRVQHYGWRYDYTARAIRKESYMGPLPGWMDGLIENLRVHPEIGFVPDQAIINEYIADQGISAHIDCEPCFGDTIVSLSLGGNAMMLFEKGDAAQTKIEIPLEPRSVVIMKNDCRYQWKHSIPARKTDTFLGVKSKRTRRVSITFRQAIL